MNTLGTVLNHNQTMDVKLGDNIYKVSPLTVTDIHSHFEGKIKQKLVDDARMMAEALPKEDRVTFITQAWKSIPTGAEMDGRIAAQMNSISGIQECFFKAISKLNKVTIDDVRKYINLDTLFDFIAAFYFLVGVESKEDEEAQPVGEPQSEGR